MKTKTTSKWNKVGDRYILENLPHRVSVIIEPKGFAGLFGSKRTFDMYFDGNPAGIATKLSDAKAQLEEMLSVYNFQTEMLNSVSFPKKPTCVGSGKINRSWSKAWDRGQR